ncbi:MAG: hypothetical protein IKV45_00645 [Firmicutes bacterium]|nr:hypothetical protein [Bacillota bacterium]
MKTYTAKIENAATPAIVADDMFLTTDMATAAGSKMLDNYMSLFEAEVLTRAKAAGYTVAGKADVGEFAIDLLGETSYNGMEEATLKNAAAEIVKAGEAEAAIVFDVNGSVRRAAAQYDLISIKPTYGTVSRFGTIPVACSGETVSVLAANTADAQKLLDAIAGHDAKDGTSLSDDVCAQIKSDADVAAVKKVAILSSMVKAADADVAAKIEDAKAVFAANGIEAQEIDDEIFAAARVAWNILMSAELCNNVSRYDGVKYGYRAANFNGLDELYTNSRTEAFGELLKTVILYGSDVLSTDNYDKVYDKALRIRRVMVEALNKLFAEFDAVMLPACSAMAYTAEQVKANKYMALEENLFTAPASISGLPTVVVGGVQLMGKAFSDQALIGAAKLFEKEGK